MKALFLILALASSALSFAASTECSVWHTNTVVVVIGNGPGRNQTAQKMQDSIKKEILQKGYIEGSGPSSVYNHLYIEAESGDYGGFGHDYRGKAKVEFTNLETGEVVKSNVGWIKGRTYNKATLNAIKEALKAVPDCRIDNEADEKD
jgi:hypothetical protein